LRVIELRWLIFFIFGAALRIALTGLVRAWMEGPLIKLCVETNRVFIFIFLAFIAN
jgi:hypothetical protein